MGLFKGIFGANAYSNRELKRITPIKNKVLALDEEYSALSDAELKGKTQQFKDRLENGETLDDILPEALATVREGAWRVLKKKPYEVQIIGAIVLH
ncbi:MAG: preprotein translocase subunit SecA, partial [Ruminococcus sp.]|nr:preprotein translocase subunit SecA [Ruminococcus sp.]